jgi:hypothetical protein
MHKAWRFFFMLGVVSVAGSGKQLANDVPIIRVANGAEFAAAPGGFGLPKTGRTLSSP